MKRAGEVLSALFDERSMKKAQGYSRLFSYWNAALRKSGIAAAADHSRIQELDRGVLKAEADHPGWLQILQTKESIILDDFRQVFSDMNISAISIMLSRGERTAEAVTEGTESNPEPAGAVGEETVAPHDETAISGYDIIKDDSFKTTLKYIEQNIAQREKSEAASKLGQFLNHPSGKKQELP